MVKYFRLTVEKSLKRNTKNLNFKSTLSSTKYILSPLRQKSREIEGH